MNDQSILPYVIFGVLIALLIGGGILVRVKRFGGANKRQYKQAVLIKTEREYGEIQDPSGVTHRGVTSMQLTFQFRDGSTKTFPVNNKMRGKCSEHDWGNLMYEGDKLLKFECKSGVIGTKLYVPAKNSVFHKFSQK